MVKFRIFFNIILKDAICELQIIAPKMNFGDNSIIWDYGEMLKEFLALEQFKNSNSMDETGDAKNNPEKKKLEFDANFISRIFKATLHAGYMEPPYTVLKKTLHCFHDRSKERAVLFDTHLKTKCMYLENAIEDLNERLKYTQSTSFNLWDATLKKTLADDGKFLNIYVCAHILFKHQKIQNQNNKLMYLHPIFV